MANDIFLKIDDLEGDSLDNAGNKHAKSISVLGWSWALTQTGTTHLSSGGGSGKVSVNDISFTKRIDTTSTNLVQKCCDGTHFKKAVFTMRKAGGKNPVEFLKIELSDLIISSVSASVAPESETVIENVTLNFAKVKLTYTPQDKDGNPLAEMPASWDIPGNSTVG
jgi:type VI secretion system secreted protein Hcp